MSDELVFYTNPMSRGRIVRWMLEEVGQPYRTELLDYSSSMKSADYLAINPMGKVPAIRHGDVVVTETIALYIYLSDLFPHADLAPALDDPQRGPYLRWLVFYAACFEPAVGDRAMKREPAPRAQSPYADFETTLKTLTDQLARGPYLLGERFSAADVLWGNALRWVTGFGMVEATPLIKDYIERVTSRPAQVRAQQADAALAKEMGIE
ncbi:MAG: glutathione S-transferase family protein [Rhodanobacteraceae bacterium]